MIAVAGAETNSSGSETKIILYAKSAQILDPELPLLVEICQHKKNIIRSSPLNIPN